MSIKSKFQNTRSKGSKTITTINTRIGKILKKPLLFCGVWSIILTFVLEILGRRSLVDAVLYFVDSPLIFIYNALIIMLTLCVALLFRRRYFVLFLVSVFWLGSGIANFVLLGFRTTPFSAIDLTLIPYALSIIDIYLSKTQIKLLTVLLILVIIAVLFLAFKAPKHKGKMMYKRYLCALAVITATVFTISYVGAETKVIGARFGNLADAYENFGFAYCLSNSFIDSGIGKPLNYSEENMKEIRDPLEANAKDDSQEQHPNVIFIQLESFFDANYLNNVSFNENPVPVFTELKEKFPSGFLNVPSVGAGTANTEFEILTGMNLDYFGAGEYPYKTILLEETCESMAYNLKESGYYTYAMHNNRASFYGRDEVFSMLGFDCFDSKEYMQNIEYTAAGWAKDEVLIGEMLKAMEKTQDQQDFIYTITVQGHGKYTAKTLDQTEPIQLTMAEGEDVDAYASFVKQLHEVDTFIGDLLEELENYGEDTVVVMYGDHLPSLEIGSTDLKNGSLYQTEYVIWNNFDLEAEDKDVATYELSAYVLGLLGIDNGIITKFHQQNTGSFTYLQDLEKLQYDMLYGKKYIYDGVSPYQPTDLKMGIDEIYITDVLYYQGTSTVYVFGEGFTDASYIYVNYERKPTTFINNNTLMLNNYDLNNGDVLVVKQAGKNRIPLSSTVAYTFAYPADTEPEETHTLDYYEPGKERTEEPKKGVIRSSDYVGQVTPPEDTQASEEATPETTEANGETN